MSLSDLIAYLKLKIQLLKAQLQLMQMQQAELNHGVEPIAVTSYIQSPSPNFSDRQGYKPEMIMVHCTDGHFPYDMQYLQNPNPQSLVGPVSAHFVVAPDGTIHQLVQLDKMAWHAGRVLNPTAKLKKDATGAFVNPNYYSIGIETSLVATEQIGVNQLISLKKLVHDLAAQFSIPLDRAHIVGHHEIYQLKTCPGTINVDMLITA